MVLEDSEKPKQKEKILMQQKKYNKEGHERQKKGMIGWTMLDQNFTSIHGTYK